MEKKVEYRSSTKRLAKNTIMLYTRQILIILVSLYTSRVVLGILGAEDYGIYNVVGGFVTMFNVVAGAFSIAIARFMSYMLEKGDKEELKKLFSTSLIIQIISGAVVCILIATFGVWYVSNKMVIPGDRVDAAKWVLLFSTISFFISLISVPYNSLIIAHEHMKAYAYISFMEAILKFMVAILLSAFNYDKLVVYSILTVTSSLFIRFVYATYCKKHFSESKFKFVLDKNLFIRMMSFIGWAFLGNGAIVLKDQGINMILNLFGGPIVNAARAIAVSVNSAISGFMNNFVHATQPQITRLCSSKKYDEMNNLIYQSCRISYFLMLLMCMPIIKNIDYVLKLWLGEVPQYTSIFVILALVDTLVASINNPLLYGVLAEGRIKVYEILLCTIYVVGIISVYVYLAFGGHVEMVYVITVFLRVLVLLLLIWQSCRLYQLSIGKFIKNVMTPISFVTILALVITLCVNIKMKNMFLLFLIESSIIVIGVLVCIFVLGITNDEKQKIVKFLKDKIKKVVRYKRKEEIL